jgi:hypothetical protein
MVKLTDVTGIGPVTAKLLSERKIKTVEALAAISLTELQKIPSFSDIRARAVKKAAADCLRSNKTTQQLVTRTGSSQKTAAKKVVSQKTTGEKITAYPIGDEESGDKDKKKDKKIGKKEKVKEKKQKDKIKNKDKKKSDKKKDKKKS